jgi:MoxR-like ATPase
MTFHVFRGAGPLVPNGILNPLPSLRAALTDEAGYIAPAGLRDAVNVALALGMPLLLTGEPGTGKTQLAYRLAAELGLGKPLRFDTKSSSVANELFYQFDNVAHFADAQVAALSKSAARPAQDFVRYRALGSAILRSNPWFEIQHLVSPMQRDEIEPYCGKPSVVLIDEVDKAPRDFPNDLLNQIEDMSFAVPELGNEYPRFLDKSGKRPIRADGIGADKNNRPVVVITSNSEKQLPEAFLRRCVYHHIEFPKTAEQRHELVEAILAARLSGLGRKHGAGYAAALAVYFAMRDDGAVEKKPSTSELLDWMSVLQAVGIDWDLPLVDQADKVRPCTHTLAKTEADKTLLRVQLNLPD